jgi:hypothetical protein
MWLRPTSRHSMPRRFANHEFSDRWALYWNSIVLWLANSTWTSAIYKFAATLPHHTLFRDTQFAHESFETCNLTFESSHFLGSYCHLVLKPLRPLSIFHHFLESLSCLQFHTYPTFFACGFPDMRTALLVFLDLQIVPPASKIYKLTSRLLHQPSSVLHNMH